VTGTRDGSVTAEADRYQVWDRSTNWAILEVPLGTSARSLSLASDGSRLVSGDGQRTNIWDVSGGKRLRQIPGEELPLALSPNGEILAAGTKKGMVLRKAGSGEKIWEVNDPRTAGVRAACFSPNGSLLLTDSTVWRFASDPRLGVVYQSLYQRAYLGFEGDLAGREVVLPRFTKDDGSIGFVAGRVGRALHLDGGLEFPETQGTRVGDSFTVQFWFRLDPWRVGTYQRVVASQLLSFGLRDRGHSPWVFLGFLNQGGHSSISLREHMGPVVPGRWYHLAVVHDGPDKTLRVYLDGASLFSQPAEFGVPTADRVGSLSFGSWWEGSRFQGALDEFALYDYVRTPEQIAADGQRGQAADQPPPRQPLPIPVERPILPERVSEFIEKEERTEFTVYRFLGDLSNLQLLDIDVAGGVVWVGTGRGLLRFDPASGAGALYGANAGMPGERVSRLAVAGEWVAADLDIYTGRNSVRGVGTYLFDPRAKIWTPLLNGFVWDLFWDGSRLWVGRADGAEARGLDGSVERFRPNESGLLHKAVHAIQVWRDTVWFAMLSDHVKEKNDFVGGGVSFLNRLTGEWRSYTTREGMARNYSCDIAVDDRRVFVAHWHEEKGLSLFDRKTERWSVLLKSENGVELGGVVLANDENTLWIGQQRGLVKLDKETRRATLYRELEGMPGYIVSGIAIDRDAVWVSAYSYGTPEFRSAGPVRIPRRK
jgi:hypothetical protein